MVADPYEENRRLFADKAVPAKSIEDFLDRYYKPDRFRGRGEEYAACLIASHQRDFDREGYDIISHHDSATGQVVAYFGPSNDPPPWAMQTKEED